MVAVNKVRASQESESITAELIYFKVRTEVVMMTAEGGGDEANNLIPPPPCRGVLVLSLDYKSGPILEVSAIPGRPVAKVEHSPHSSPPRKNCVNNPRVI